MFELPVIAIEAATLVLGYGWLILWITHMNDNDKRQDKQDEQ